MSEIHFKLEKCPFCGNEARLFGEGNLAPYVSCMTCGASTKEVKATTRAPIADAIVAAVYYWNRRPAFDDQPYKWYWIRRSPDGRISAALVERSFSPPALRDELISMAQNGPIERVYESRVVIGEELKNCIKINPEYKP